MGLKFNTGDRRKDKVLSAISNMKYHDLKAGCIIRGLDFDSVVNGTFPRLSTWLERHWDNKKDHEKLKEFDNFMDQKLKERGYKKKHPLRKFRQMSPELKPQVEKPPKPIKVEKPKVKREKDTKYNIYKGTKKELVYRLSNKLFDQFGKKYNNKDLVRKFYNQVLVKVGKKFTDGVNEKSVKIWMKRSLDSIRK